MKTLTVTDDQYQTMVMALIIYSHELNAMAVSMRRAVESSAEEHSVKRQLIQKNKRKAFKVRRFANKLSHAAGANNND